MVNVAIIEDVKKESDLLKKYLIDFSNEYEVGFNISVHNSVKSFLSSEYSSLDIIFIDIELGDGNGMDLAKKIRENDKKVIIIFVTNMSQYAVKGYEVRAFDFIVKPVVYENLTVKLSATLHCLKSKKDVGIWVSNKEGRTLIQSSNIKYIEVFQHMLVYHLSDGKTISASGSLSMITKELSGASFSLCNRCYLVNLKYVTAINHNDVFLGEEKLIISRAKRSLFIRELNDYLAEGD